MSQRSIRIVRPAQPKPAQPKIVSKAVLQTGTNSRPGGIRQYAMSWLLRAACRVNERGTAQHDEDRRRLRVMGLSGLFDLSDTEGPEAPAVGSARPPPVPPAKNGMPLPPVALVSSIQRC